MPQRMGIRRLYPRPLSIADLDPVMWLRVSHDTFQDIAKTTWADRDAVIGAWEDQGYPKDTILAADVEQAVTAKKPLRKQLGVLFDGSDDYLYQKIYEDETGASWGPANHGISLVDGNAFLRVQGVDLSPFAGVEGTDTPYMVVLVDQAGKVAWGYLGAADAAEALGADKTITGITKANPGIVTFQAGHGFTGGELIKWKNLTEMTELNGKYCTLDNKAGDTFEIVDTSGYVAAETTGGVCANQVTDAGTDAAHLVSTRHGSTRNWAGIQAGFDYNDSAYTFEVRKTWAQITGDLTVGCWINTSATDGGIISKSDASSARSWAIRIKTPGVIEVRISLDGTASTATDSTAQLNDSKWHFIVCTVDITTPLLLLYVDGLLDKSAAGYAALFDSPSSFVLGRRGNATQYLAATLNEVFILDYVLHARRIRQLYEDNKGRYT